MEGGEDSGADIADVENEVKKCNTECPFNFPPGYRFHPNDDELIHYYLNEKVLNRPLPYNNINDVDLYQFNPKSLTAKFQSNDDKEWYFFTPRKRKYKNGSRPNRAAGNGYWKATEADKPIIRGTKPVGVKKTLVFYEGKQPKGTKTNWVMHELRLHDTTEKPRKNDQMELDDWVLCKIYEKPNTKRAPRVDDQVIAIVNSNNSIDELSYKTNTPNTFECTEMSPVASDSLLSGFCSDYALNQYISWNGNGYPPSLNQCDPFNNHFDSTDFGQLDQLLAHEPITSDHLMMMNKYQPKSHIMNTKDDLYASNQDNWNSSIYIQGQFNAGYQDDIKDINQIKEMQQQNAPIKHQAVLPKRRRKFNAGYQDDIKDINQIKEMQQQNAPINHQAVLPKRRRRN